LYLKPSPSPQPVTRAVINLPPGQQLAGLDGGPVVALSPDGAHLAYVARQGAANRFICGRWIAWRPGPSGNGRSRQPLLSPDDQWVGFFVSGKLKKVLVSGGAALTLGDAGPTPPGASWGSQGMISFASTLVGALQQVSDVGARRRS